MNVQKERIDNVRSSDRKFKLMILKNKERYAPHPCKDNFARFSVADPSIAGQEVARPPPSHPEPSRAVAVLDEIRAGKHVPSLRLARPALPGLKDRKTRLAAPPKRSWQWRKDEERGWWQGGGGGGLS